VYEQSASVSVTDISFWLVIFLRVSVAQGIEQMRRLYKSSDSNYAPSASLCLRSALMNDKRYNTRGIKFNLSSLSSRKQNDFVTVTNICDTDNRALFLYRLQAYLSKKQSLFVAFIIFLSISFFY